MNLGVIISRFARLDADRAIMHDDVSAWSAPSECHGDVRRGYERELAELEAELGITEQELAKKVNDMGFDFHRIYEECVNRIYTRENPFI